MDQISFLARSSRGRTITTTTTTTTATTTTTTTAPTPRTTPTAASTSHNKPAPTPTAALTPVFTRLSRLLDRTERAINLQLARINSPKSRRRQRSRTQRKPSKASMRAARQRELEDSLDPREVLAEIGGMLKVVERGLGVVVEEVERRAMRGGGGGGEGGAVAREMAVTGRMLRIWVQRLGRLAVVVGDEEVEEGGKQKRGD